MEEFKSRIKKLRNENGLNYSKLASLFNKSEGAVRAWEAGRTKPDADTLIEIAKHFEVTIDYLLGLDDAKSKGTSNIMKETGLSELSIKTLKECFEIDKKNSITLTINTLLETRSVLGEISRYLYYQLDDNINEEMHTQEVVPYVEKYKYYDGNFPCWNSGNSYSSVDPHILLNALTPEIYKSLRLLKVQQELSELLKEEEKKIHFEA